MHKLLKTLISPYMAAIALAGVLATLTAAVLPLESLGVVAVRTTSNVAAQIAAATNIQQPTYQAALAAPEAYEQTVINTVARSMPAVVAIVATRDVVVIGQCTERNGRVTYYVPCQKGIESKEVGGGSGFFVTSDGLIVTNKHVVADAQASYTVFTPNGKSYPAKVVVADAEQDLAVLRVQGSGFATLSIGDSEGVRLGQTAIAIGNALGQFSNTVSIGVISGLNRTVTATGSNRIRETLTNAIQTDTAINSGSSGGPLLNLQGQVVGVTTAVASNAQNIGFALPANRINSLIQQAQISINESEGAFDKIARLILTVTHQGARNVESV